MKLLKLESFGKALISNRGVNVDPKSNLCDVSAKIMEHSGLSYGINFGSTTRIKATTDINGSFKTLNPSLLINSMQGELLPNHFYCCFDP